MRNSRNRGPARQPTVTFLSGDTALALFQPLPSGGGSLGKSFCWKVIQGPLLRVSCKKGKVDTWFWIEIQRLC